MDGRSQSASPAAAAAVPSLGAQKQTWAGQGSQQLPALCSRSQAALPAGLQTRGEFPAPLPHWPQPKLWSSGQEPRGASRSSCSWWQGWCPGVPSRDTKEGFVIPEHSQIPVDCSIQELPCSPSKCFKAELSHEEKQQVMSEGALARWDLGMRRGEGSLNLMGWSQEAKIRGSSPDPSMPGQCWLHSDPQTCVQGILLIPAGAETQPGAASCRSRSHRASGPLDS